MIVHRGNSDNSIIQIHGSISPADSTSYVLGGIGITATSGGGVTNVYIPRAGTITKAYIHQLVSPTLGTTETSTVSVRLNNSTNTTITSIFQQDQTTETFSNTSLSIAVVAGDFVEILWVTPAWVTNPTIVYIGVSLLLE